MENIENFYDDISAEYATKIARCVPRYREMHDNILRYVPATLHPERVLELGCGSGMLSQRLLDAFPSAEFHLVDVSRSMLDLCRQKLAQDKNIVYHQMDFRRVGSTGEWQPASFDLVASSIAIHHLEHTAKQSLFRHVYSLLRPAGIFVYADQFAGSTPDIYAKHMAEWKREAHKLGCTEEEWETWMEHQKEQDHHAPIEMQWQWLERAGFTTIDCLWRYLLWTILLAKKS